MARHDLIRYFSGKTSADESKQIKDWMKNPANEKEVRGALGNIWANADIELPREHPDFESLLGQIRQRISSKENNGSRFLSGPVFRMFSRVAAILFFPLLISVLFLYLKTEPFVSDGQLRADQKEIYTKPGTRMKTELPDGTLVWLHDGTTLRYPEPFRGRERRVFVDGEAYFEVASDEDHPFVVENPFMETTVTGTKFNLDAYSADGFFEATLQEGKISLKNSSGLYRMSPGQKLHYDAKTGEIARQQVNPYLSSAWIEGKLIMQDEPLNIAVKKISRWYNIEVVLQDPALHNYYLTATIENEKPEQTLKLISMALPVDYTAETLQTANKTKRIFYLKKRK